MRSKLLGLSVVMMTVLFGSLAGAKTAQAQSDVTNAVQTMPKGLPLTPYFETGINPGSGFNPVLQNSSNASSTGTQAMQLTSDAVKGGSTVWSKDAFKFNLFKNQKASMWMYFGNKKDTAGDGMAFVLQNQGTNAYSDQGQSLGVWGVDRSSDTIGTKTANLVADTAIQDSWALEFDTFPNTTQPDTSGIKTVGGLLATKPADKDIAAANSANTKIADLGTGFDSDVGSGEVHIASNYPGDPSTYDVEKLVTVTQGIWGTGTNSSILGVPAGGAGNKYTYYWTKMNHEGVLKTTDRSYMSDGNWHHLTLDYKAPTTVGGFGSMTYTYNDKNPQTGAVQTSGAYYGDENAEMSKTVDIDPSKLGATSDNPLVWWGFTGSTGENTENSLVAFEQIPNVANINSSGTMTDTTTNKVISDKSTIQGNDHVKVNYNVSYDSGTSAWENIKSKIAVPQNITYKTAKITYTKKSGATETVTLDSSDISQNGIDLQLDHDLNNESDSDYVSADITLTGVAKNPSTQTTIAATTGSFTGTQAIASVDIPSFKVAPSTLNLQLDQSKVTASGDSDVQLTGKITSTATLDSNDKLILHPSINGNDLTTSKLSTTDKPGIFTVSVPVKQLSSGENTFEVYATDSTGNSSNTGAVTITLGSLSFGTVSDSAAFKDTTLDGSQQTAGTNGDWNLNVQDTRAVGSQWTLSAKISQPFKVNDQALKGSLMYKTANGTEAITADNTPIVTHTKTASDSSTTNVAGSWNTDSGLLLDVGSSNTAGTYSGQLTWTLQDAPQ
ncbi:hypothetical protein EFR94_00220 [Levilactobacillus brevis]|uniref:WxL domain-containing protein n=1 Tax=Levilactobacillus brevis TaxID=1580 RepID=UPI0021A39009|nr:WxL domain-containing protein [Levilactobacillus brevis]MCT3565819.1 hypothetical protein [Levilactobacillus brevis]